jgi:hypothetical protein
MICSDIKWGIIACMDQSGKLHFYPVPYNDQLVAAMLKAYEEFWHLVRTDGEYPDEAAKPEAEVIDITELLPKTNADLEQLCADYLKASAEANAWSKTKSETVNKPKKRMVETGEFIESLSFSVKEVSGE